MAEPIGGMRIELSAENAKLIQDLGKAQRSIGKFSRETEQQMKGFQASIVGLGKTFFTVFGATALARGIHNTQKLGDELAKMSQRTGLTVEFLNGFTQAAGVADVSQQSLSVGIRTLNKNLLDMTQGTGEAKDSLEAMGISGTDAAALLKTPEESLLKIMDLLSRIPDASRRGAVAQELLGRAGADWLPLINQGTEAIRQQIAHYQKLRPLTKEEAKAAEAYNDSLRDLGYAVEGLGVKLTSHLIPALTSTFELTSQLASWNYSDAFSTLLPRIDMLDFKLGGLREKLISTTESIGSFTFRNLTKGSQEQFQKFIETLLEVKFKPGGGAKPPAAPQDPVPMLPEETVNELSQSAELKGLIDRREALIKLIEAEEADKEIKSDRVRILQEEIALLQEAYAIQKEIEAANKEGKTRAIDQNVAITARIEKEARLKEIQNERVKLFKQLNAEEQEILGTDIQHGLNIEQQTKQQGILNQFTREQQDIQRVIAQAGDDTSKVRAGQILLIESRVNLLKKENETLGETKARNEQINELILDANALRKEGHEIEQKALGRGIVAGASVDIEKQFADRRRAVRDAEHQLELGSIARGQTRQDQRVREIQLIEAKLQLLYEEQRLGLVNTEQANNQFDVLVTEFNNASNPQGFLEGWQNAFQQFSDDAQGAFGLGQTLARQFTQNVQGLGASITQNVFDKLEEGTLSWKSALETIPDLLQRITSQLIGMAIAQGVASAIGGGLGGLFGGGAPGATPNATARGALNPNLFGPGFASGADFMVGGRGGVDANFFPMRLSKGERVMIETPAQQREGRGGGEMTVNVHNYAGVDIQQEERQTPSGRSLEVYVRRQVRQVNEGEYKLSRGPGRVG
ncbi:MAG: hypothetical protein NPIRA03_06770 [Nitrospirales bacterium]|nr:MAG: hypothetical protein NPIRA03_06770 [Nitrospirales bacterium]